MRERGHETRGGSWQTCCDHEDHWEGRRNQSSSAGINPTQYTTHPSAQLSCAPGATLFPIMQPRGGVGRWAVRSPAACQGSHPQDAGCRFLLSTLHSLPRLETGARGGGEALRAARRPSQPRRPFCGGHGGGRPAGSGRPVGSGVPDRLADTGRLERLWGAPTRRGNGVGARLAAHSGDQCSCPPGPSDMRTCVKMSWARSHPPAGSVGAG